MVPGASPGARRWPVSDLPTEIRSFRRAFALIGSGGATYASEAKGNFRLTWMQPGRCHGVAPVADFYRGHANTAMLRRNNEIGHPIAFVVFINVGRRGITPDRTTGARHETVSRSAVRR